MGSMFDYLMWTYGGEIIALIVTTIFFVLGIGVYKLVKIYLDDKRKQDIARASVKFVEQRFKELYGEEKLHAALNRASAIMAEKGIKFSITEMEALCEAAVFEIN